MFRRVGKKKQMIILVGMESPNFKDSINRVVFASNRKLDICFHIPRIQCKKRILRGYIERLY